ncbi:hypothetical protein ACLB2K_011259 [Fragaria x ananassa]
MAEKMSPVLINHRTFEPANSTVLSSHHSSFMDQNPNVHTIVAVDDIEIPTVDCSVLLSDDLEERSKAIKNIGHVCEDFGFFYVCYFVQFSEEGRRDRDRRSIMIGREVLSEIAAQTSDRDLSGLILHSNTVAGGLGSRRGEETTSPELE